MAIEFLSHDFACPSKKLLVPAMWRQLFQWHNSPFVPLITRPATVPSTDCKRGTISPVMKEKRKQWQKFFNFSAK